MTTQAQSTVFSERDLSSEQTPREMAQRICEGFIAHDRHDREAAIEAFEFVDTLQYPHVDSENVHFAACAFVDALWAKDDVEVQYLQDGTLNRDRLREADWSPVRKKFRERAALLGIDQEYAELKTEAWRRHKTGGDYWTPFQKAQVMEIQAALQDSSYPEKPNEGHSGPGPEAIRYTLGVELHDMHTAEHWKQAVEAMTPYFEYIISHHHAK